MVRPIMSPRASPPSKSTGRNKSIVRARTFALYASNKPIISTSRRFAAQCNGLIDEEGDLTFANCGNLRNKNLTIGSFPMLTTFKNSSMWVFVSSFVNEDDCTVLVSFLSNSTRFFLKVRRVFPSPASPG